MPKVGPSGVPDKPEPPDGRGWQAVMVLTVTAAAVTLTAIFTRSAEMAVLVGTVLRGR